MLILVTFEVLSSLEGYSFFAFGPGPEVINQIILDIILGLVVIGWIFYDRRSKIKHEQILIKTDTK
jgi:hypothetical protein